MPFLLPISFVLYHCFVVSIGGGGGGGGDGDGDGDGGGDDKEITIITSLDNVA